MEFRKYIQKNKTLIGMIHIRALPGTPQNNLSPEKIITKALEEAKTLKKLGINTVLIENMHDIPYIKKVGPEVTSLMAIIGKEIKKMGLYCGIQILAAANKEALAVAKASGLDFIRAEGYVFAHVADEGYIESCAGELLRYRKQINAENILIFTDIKKKHSSHSITSDISIEETAHAAEFFLADSLIVTGVSTGTTASLEEVITTKNSTKLPIAIGSGITTENLKNYFKHADIFIVGSFIKEKGNWKNKISKSRTKSLIEEFKKLK